MLAAYKFPKFEVKCLIRKPTLNHGSLLIYMFAFILSQEMQLVGQRDQPLKHNNLDVCTAMRAFYVELATYVNISHSTTCQALVSNIR